MNKGIEFLIECKEITDFEKFNSNEDLISDLKNLIFNDYKEWQISIGFGLSNLYNKEVLKCNGKFLGYSKKELKAELTIFKGKLTRILEKYYNKIKPEVVMELYFDKI